METTSCSMIRVHKAQFNPIPRDHRLQQPSPSSFQRPRPSSCQRPSCFQLPSCFQRPSCHDGNPVEPRKFSRSPARSFCIYIVDNRIRDRKPDAYTPDTVSIGPYHRKRKKTNWQMRAMENLKKRYVDALLVRTRISRDDYKEAIKAIKPDPRECYFDRFHFPREEEFLEVMLVDGLFIIELFRKYAKAIPVRDAEQSGAEVDKNVVLRWMKNVSRWMQIKKDADEKSAVEVAEESSVDVEVATKSVVDAEVVADADEQSAVEVAADDPIFYSDLKRTRVIRDLALLENQIPMSVLQALFEKSKNGDSNQLSLVELALHFFEELIPGAKDKYTSSEEQEHKHLLDLLSFTLEARLPLQKKLQSTSTAESLPCVTELRHSGVQFKRSGNKDASLMDLNFHKNGVFEIPTIYVSDFTDPFFRNLIAYEQHHYESCQLMTSYAVLMDYLINSAADVATLCDCGIISNYLGDDKKVASLFNNLCSEICNSNFIYGELCNDVRNYYKFFWNEWKASLQRDFCNSPWTIIPVVAAVILLLLSVWSALFSAFPVFNVSFRR